MVALEIVDSHAGICLAQFVENGVEVLRAVNSRLANAKQVQVGPVYYGYVLHVPEFLDISIWFDAKLL